MHVTTSPPDTEPPAGAIVVSRDLVRNVHAPYAARRLARRQLVGWGLPGLLDTTELIADELTANAVEHGAGHFIAVRLERRDNAVVVKVWDANDDQMPVLPDSGAGLLEEHGRGLLLTDALASEWGSYRATTGGKVVWATCS